ncbi:MAG: DUF229 domain-containing protein [Planctomycetota bacterium]|nr:MAG: DUF229 domain-containing protein [Planctomycetota bacterium]
MHTTESTPSAARNRHAWLVAATALLGAACVTGCGGGEQTPAAPSGKPAARPIASGPNILWIVWDTVRRDHLGVYGYDRPTTPFLDEWSRQARVYTNCVSAGSSTVPSHGAMFTGLLPSEHGASNKHPQLDERFDTIAELLHASGYDTYLFSANPHIARSTKFAQGFEVAEHPWSEQYKKAAFEILRSKVDPRDQSNEIARKVNRGASGGAMSEWNIKAAGPLAQQGLEAWLADRNSQRPYFAFLNYMEAHRHLMPSPEFRDRFLTPEEVERNFKVDRTWKQTWGYVFGQAEYSEEELALTRKTYDACIAELDDLLRRLLTSLEKRGALENTIVIVTSDHGEHLGEHHLLDHQFSLYNELLYVPLIVKYPPAFPPGRDDKPVMSFDLFPTLLDLAGVAPPIDLQTQAIDLRRTPAQRKRLAEFPDWTDGPIQATLKNYPDFTPEVAARWQVRMRALYEGGRKFICASNGRRELYDVAADPHELTNLLVDHPEWCADRHAALASLLAKLRPLGQRESLGEMSPAEIEQLQALGYAGGDEENANEGAEDYCSCGSDASDEPAGGE